MGSKPGKTQDPGLRTFQGLRPRLPLCCLGSIKNSKPLLSISYLLPCDKQPLTQHLKQHLSSHSFCGSGFCPWLSQVPVTSLVRPQLGCTRPVVFYSLWGRSASSVTHVVAGVSPEGRLMTWPLNSPRMITQDESHSLLMSQSQT